ncbi:MAG TPA: hypothetical protein VFW89_06390 [Gemmatimonadaceae bacterium]|nr:hypothetical protein [Gemmatimonadaceae bacterium]
MLRLAARLSALVLSALASGAATTRAPAQQGARFRCSAPQTHCRAMRVAWTFLRPDNTEVAHEMDFHELAPDGRIRRVTVFFGAPPVVTP